MSWISLLIALIITGNNGANLVGNIWWYQYLTNLVTVEQFFFTLSWVIFAVVLIFLIVIAVRVGLNNWFGGLGCVSVAILVFLGILPLFEWITLCLARGMLAAFDPVFGILNQGSFILNAILFLLLGVG